MEWLTTKQVAQYLSCSTHWLYQLAAQGVGPPRRQLGSRRWKYLRRDVDEWVLSEPDLSVVYERTRRWREQHAADQSEQQQAQPKKRARGQ